MPRRSTRPTTQAKTNHTNTRQQRQLQRRTSHQQHQQRPNSSSTPPSPATPTLTSAAPAFEFTGDEATIAERAASARPLRRQKRSIISMTPPPVSVSVAAASSSPTSSPPFTHAPITPTTTNITSPSAAPAAVTAAVAAAVPTSSRTSGRKRKASQLSLSNNDLIAPIFSSPSTPPRSEHATRRTSKRHRLSPRHNTTTAIAITMNTSAGTDRQTRSGSSPASSLSSIATPLSSPRTRTRSTAHHRNNNNNRRNVARATAAATSGQTSTRNDNNNNNTNNTNNNQRDQTNNNGRAKQPRGSGRTTGGAQSLAAAVGSAPSLPASSGSRVNTRAATRSAGISTTNASVATATVSLSRPATRVTKKKSTRATAAGPTSGGKKGVSIKRSTAKSRASPNSVSISIDTPTPSTTGTDPATTTITTDAPASDETAPTANTTPVAAVAVVRRSRRQRRPSLRVSLASQSQSDIESGIVSPRASRTSRAVTVTNPSNNNNTNVVNNTTRTNTPAARARATTVGGSKARANAGSNKQKAASTRRGQKQQRQHRQGGGDDEEDVVVVVDGAEEEDEKSDDSDDVNNGGNGADTVVVVEDGVRTATKSGNGGVKTSTVSGSSRADTPRIDDAALVSRLAMLPGESQESDAAAALSQSQSQSQSQSPSQQVVVDAGVTNTSAEKKKSSMTKVVEAGAAPGEKDRAAAKAGVVGEADQEAAGAEKEQEVKAAAAGEKKAADDTEKAKAYTATGDDDEKEADDGKKELAVDKERAKDVVGAAKEKDSVVKHSGSNNTEAARSAEDKQKEASTSATKEAMSESKDEGKKEVESNAAAATDVVMEDLDKVDDDKADTTGKEKEQTKATTPPSPVAATAQGANAAQGKAAEAANTPASSKEGPAVKTGLPRGSGDQPQKGAGTAVSPVNQATSGTTGQPKDEVMQDAQPGKAADKAEATAAVKAVSVSEPAKKQGGQHEHEEKCSQKRSRLSDDEVSPTKKATTGSDTAVEERSGTPQATPSTVVELGEKDSRAEPVERRSRETAPEDGKEDKSTGLKMMKASTVDTPAVGNRSAGSSPSLGKSPDGTTVAAASVKTTAPENLAVEKLRDAGNDGTVSTKTTTSAVKKTAVAASTTNVASVSDGAKKATTQRVAGSKKASVVTVIPITMSEVVARSSSAAAQSKQQQRSPGRSGIQVDRQTPRDDSPTDTLSSLSDVSSMKLSSPEDVEMVAAGAPGEGVRRSGGNAMEHGDARQRSTPTAAATTTTAAAAAAAAANTSTAGVIAKHTPQPQPPAPKTVGGGSPNRATNEQSRERNSGHGHSAKGAKQQAGTATPATTAKGAGGPSKGSDRSPPSGKGAKKSSPAAKNLQPADHNRRAPPDFSSAPDQKAVRGAASSASAAAGPSSSSASARPAPLKTTSQPADDVIMKEVKVSATTFSAGSPPAKKSKAAGTVVEGRPSLTASKTAAINTQRSSSVDDEIRPGPLKTTANSGGGGSPSRRGSPNRRGSPSSGSGNNKSVAVAKKSFKPTSIVRKPALKAAAPSASNQRVNSPGKRNKAAEEGSGKPKSPSSTKRVRFAEPSQPLRTSGRNMRLLQLMRRRHQRALRKGSPASGSSAGASAQQGSEGRQSAAAANDLSISPSRFSGASSSSSAGAAASSSSWPMSMPDKMRLQEYVDELQYLLDGIFRKESSPSRVSNGLVISSLHALIRLSLRKDGRGNSSSQQDMFTSNKSSSNSGGSLLNDDAGHDSGVVIDMLTAQPDVLTKIVRRLCTMMGKSCSVDALIALFFIIVFRAAGSTLLISQTELETLINVFVRHCALCLREEHVPGTSRKVDERMDSANNNNNQSAASSSSGMKFKRGMFAKRNEDAKNEKSTLDTLNGLVKVAGVFDEDTGSTGSAPSFVNEADAAAYFLGSGLAALLGGVSEVRVWMRDNRRLDRIVAAVYSSETLCQKWESDLAVEQPHPTAAGTGTGTSPLSATTTPPRTPPATPGTTTPTTSPATSPSTSPTTAVRTLNIPASSKRARDLTGWKIVMGGSLRILQFAALDHVCQARLTAQTRVVAISVAVVKWMGAIRVGNGLDREWVICNALKLCINLMRGADEDGSSLFVKADGVSVIFDCLIAECMASRFVDATAAAANGSSAASKAVEPAPDSTSGSSTPTTDGNKGDDGKAAGAAGNVIDGSNDATNNNNSSKETGDGEGHTDYDGCEESFDVRVLCLALLASAIDSDVAACEAFPTMKPSVIKGPRSAEALTLALEILTRSGDDGAGRRAAEVEMTEMDLFMGDIQKSHQGSKSRDGSSNGMERKITIGYVCLLAGALVHRSSANRALLVEKLSEDGLHGIAEVLQEFLEFHHEVGVLSTSVDEMYEGIIAALKRDTGKKDNGDGIRKDDGNNNNDNVNDIGMDGSNKKAADVDVINVDVEEEEEEESVVVRKKVDGLAADVSVKKADADDDAIEAVHIDGGKDSAPGVGGIGGDGDSDKTGGRNEESPRRGLGNEAFDLSDESVMKDVKDVFDDIEADDGLNMGQLDDFMDIEERIGAQLSDYNDDKEQACHL